jgi:hypothetical protein
MSDGKNRTTSSSRLHGDEHADQVRYQNDGMPTIAVLISNWLNAVDNRKRA